MSRVGAGERLTHQGAWRKPLKADGGTASMAPIVSPWYAPCTRSGIMDVARSSDVMQGNEACCRPRPLTAVVKSRVKAACPLCSRDHHVLACSGAWCHHRLSDVPAAGRYGLNIGFELRNQRSLCRSTPGVPPPAGAARGSRCCPRRHRPQAAPRGARGTHGTPFSAPPPRPSTCTRTAGVQASSLCASVPRHLCFCQHSPVPRLHLPTDHLRSTLPAQDRLSNPLSF